MALTPDIAIPERTPPAPRAWLWLVLAFVAFLPGQIVGGIVVAGLLIAGDGDAANLDPESLLIGAAVGGLVGLPISLLIAGRLYDGGIAALLGRPRSFWWLAGGVGLGLLLVTINAGLSVIGSRIDGGLEDQLQEYADQWVELFDGGNWQVAVFLLAVVVLAPLGEELVFRVLLLGGLRRLMPFWPAAAISGAIFAAIHLQPAWAVSLGLFIAGVGLAWIYRRAGYWAAVATHATVNAIAATSLLLS